MLCLFFFARLLVQAALPTCVRYTLYHSPFAQWPTLSPEPSAGTLSDTEIGQLAQTLLAKDAGVLSIDTNLMTPKYQVGFGVKLQDGLEALNATVVRIPLLAEGTNDCDEPYQIHVALHDAFASNGFSEPRSDTDKSDLANLDDAVEALLLTRRFSKDSPLVILVHHKDGVRFTNSFYQWMIAIQKDTKEKPLYKAMKLIVISPELPFITLRVFDGHSREAN